MSLQANINLNVEQSMTTTSTAPLQSSQASNAGNSVQQNLSSLDGSKDGLLQCATGLADGYSALSNSPEQQKQFLADICSQCPPESLGEVLGTMSSLVASDKGNFDDNALPVADQMGKQMGELYNEGKISQDQVNDMFALNKGDGTSNYPLGPQTMGMTQNIVNSMSEHCSNPEISNQAAQSLLNSITENPLDPQAAHGLATAAGLTSGATKAATANGDPQLANSIYKDRMADIGSLLSNGESGAQLRENLSNIPAPGSQQTNDSNSEFSNFADLLFHHFAELASQNGQAEATEEPKEKSQDDTGEIINTVASTALNVGLKVATSGIL